MENTATRWITIKESKYGNKYKISDNGEVIDTTTNMIFVKTLETSGIYSVTLGQNKKFRDPVESLVAEYYLPPNNNINAILVHIDGNLLSDCYTNLKYSDFTEPESVNYRSRHRSIFQYDLDYKFMRRWNSIVEICNANPGYKKNNIKGNVSGCNKSSHGYIWSFSRALKKEVKEVISIIDEKYFLEQDNYIIPDDGKEYWKDIINYETYKISTRGNIYSKKINIIISKSTPGGYYRVGLFKKDFPKKHFYVNQLVGIHFIKNPNNYPIVDHIDENKLNDYYKNLRWITHSGNTQEYHDKRKMPIINQYDKDNNLLKEWKDMREIIKENPTYKKNLIYDCINERSHTSHDFIWKYKNEKPKRAEVVLKEDEIFKNIGKYKKHDFSKYEVSNYGNIRSIKTKKYRTLQLHESGYYRVNLTTVGGAKKTKGVHIFVALRFCEGRSEINKIVNHIDEIKKHNYYKNLEWTTHEGNIAHSMGNKVNQIDIETGNVIKTFDSCSSAERMFTTSRIFSIPKVCKGKRNTAYGYKWEFADNNDFKIEKHNRKLDEHTQQDKHILKEYTEIFQDTSLKNYKPDKEYFKKKYNVILED